MLQATNQYWLRNSKTGKLVQYTKQSYNIMLGQMEELAGRKQMQKASANRAENAVRYWEMSGGPATIAEALDPNTVWADVELRTAFIKAMEADPVPVKKADPVPVKKAEAVLSKMSLKELGEILVGEFPDKKDEWKKLRTRPKMVEFIEKGRAA